MNFSANKCLLLKAQRGGVSGALRCFAVAALRLGKDGMLLYTLMTDVNEITELLNKRNTAFTDYNVKLFLLKSLRIREIRLGIKICFGKS